MAGIRDKLIHDYTTVDLGIVWQTLEEDLPPLIESFRRILDEPDDLC